MAANVLDQSLDTARMRALDTCLAHAHERNYLDPPLLQMALERGELRPERVVDFDDPLELCAAVLYWLRFSTPDEVASLVAGEGREAVARTWAKLDVSRRQLFRKRARVVARTLVGGGE